MNTASAAQRKRRNVRLDTWWDAFGSKCLAFLHLEIQLLVCSLPPLPPRLNSSFGALFVLPLNINCRSVFTWATMEVCFPSCGRFQLVRLLLSFNFLLFTRVLGSWNTSSLCFALGNISSPVTIPEIPLGSFFFVAELTKTLNAVNVNLKRSNLMYAGDSSTGWQWCRGTDEF